MGRLRKRKGEGNKQERIWWKVSSAAFLDGPGELGAGREQSAGWKAASCSPTQRENKCSEEIALWYSPVTAVLNRKGGDMVSIMVWGRTSGIIEVWGLPSSESPGRERPVQPALKGLCHPSFRIPIWKAVAPEFLQPCSPASLAFCSAF